jgi:hypothetical protein
MSVAKSLENSDDIKIFRVTIQYKKLLSKFDDPFDWRAFKFHNPNSPKDIIELILKLIDFLNNYFRFLKPLK